mgnify:CR=1 FL=1
MFSLNIIKLQISKGGKKQSTLGLGNVLGFLL